MSEVPSEGSRILVIAPYGRDAESVAQLLRANSYRTDICETLAGVADAIADDIGVILITEEALAADLGPLHRALGSQPAWSDVPFVLLAGHQARRQVSAESIRRRLPESAINVILLERPLSSESLISAVASAMRARQKQFQIRDQLAELDMQRIRLTTLLDNLPIGIAFLRSDGSTLLSNPAFMRYNPRGSIPSIDMAAQPHWLGTDANEQRVLPNQFPGARALRGELVAGMELLYSPEGGKPLWTRISGIPLRDEDGQMTGAISVVVDIDEQKRAQERLAVAAKGLEAQVAERTAELEDALAKLRAESEERAIAEAALRQSQKMEAVGQLTGGIAHDFNNMLTGVIGAVEITQKRLGEGRTDDVERYMDAALASARRAAGLTARLLAFSRRQSLDSRPTDINALVLSLDDLLRRTMTETIRVSVQTTDGSAIGIVDANQLESAILNLAINARDAMPGGGELTIATKRVYLDQQYCAPRDGIAQGEFVVISVTDSGAGMDAETLDKVFDPFFTTKPIGQGTGLGLSMVYGFAKQSNGQVLIASSPGAGTTIEIYLPADSASAPAPEAAAKVVVEHGAGQVVLLVEDEMIVRMLVCDVLEELGYEAVEAANAEAAIKLLDSGRKFDLMVSDVGLPGMNGRQLAEIAQNRDPDLPILFMTGYAQGALTRGDFLGRNMAMIGKPFQVEDLSAKIQDMIRRN